MKWPIDIEHYIWLSSLGKGFTDEISKVNFGVQTDNAFIPHSVGQKESAFRLQEEKNVYWQAPGDSRGMLTGKHSIPGGELMLRQLKMMLSGFKLIE